MSGLCLRAFVFNALVRDIRAVFHGHLTLPHMEMLGTAYIINANGGTENGYFSFLDLRALKVRRRLGDKTVQYSEKDERRGFPNDQCAPRRSFGKPLRRRCGEIL